MKLTSLTYILWILHYLIPLISSSKNIIQIQYKEIFPIYCGASYFMSHTTIPSSDTDLQLIATHPETLLKDVQISSSPQYTDNLITKATNHRYQTIITFSRESQQDISFSLKCELSEWIIEGEVGISSQTDNTFISNFMYAILTLSLNQTGSTFLKRTSGFIYSANNCKVNITINDMNYYAQSGYVVYPEALYENEVIEVNVYVNEYSRDVVAQDEKCTVFLEGYSMKYDNLTYVFPVNISTLYIPPGVECVLSSKMNMVVSTRFIQPASAYVEVDVPIGKDQYFYIRPNGEALHVTGKNNITFPLQKMGNMHSLLQFIPFNIKNDSQDEFDYSFKVYGSNNFAEYIEVNKYHRVFLFGNNYYNVYTLILNDNAKGKIIVSAEQGVVKTCVRILPFREKDNDSYTEDQINYRKICERKTFEFENNVFSHEINEQHLTQCDEGCAIYIALEYITINTYDPYFLLPVDVAVIISETTSVSFNQYVYGILDSNDVFAYYNVKIPFDMSRLTFTVNGKDIEMYINYGDTLPTRDNSAFNLTSNSTLTINTIDIDSSLNTFKESTFSIGIISSNIVNKHSFNFAVYPQFNDSSILHLFDSNQYGFCDNLNGEPCYFITPWHSTGNYTSTVLRLYETNYNITTSNAVITAKLVNKEIFYTLSYMDGFPEIINPSISTDNSEIFEGTNTLSIQNTPTNIMDIFSVSYHGIIDKYLIIKVENVNRKLYLFHQTNEHITYNYITSHYSYKTYRFDNSLGPVSFKMNSTMRYYFQLESGVAKLNGDLFCSSFIPYEDYVNFTDAHNSPIAITIKQYNPLPPEKIEMNSQITVEIIDRHYGKGCYVEVLEQGTVRIYIKMNVKRLDDNVTPLGRDLFEVRAFLVNSEFIAKRIEDDSILPDSNEITNFHIYENDNIIIFEANATNENNIVFFVIKMQTNKNTHAYYSLTPTINVHLVSGNNFTIPIEPNHYYMEYIDTSIMNKLTYELTLNDLNVLILEFSEKGYQKILDFAITSNVSSQYKNDTSLITSSIDYYGKIQVICNNTGIQSKKIFLTIFNTKTNFQTKDFFIKYSYSQNQYDLIDSNIVTIDNNKKEKVLKLTLKSSLKDVLQTKYIIKLFKKKDVFRRNVLNTYFENDNETETLPYLDTTVEYSQKEQGDNQNQIFLINTINLTENHFLTILAVLGNNNVIVNKISIKPQEIKIDNNFPSIIIPIIIILMALSLLAIVFILHFYVRKNLNKKTTLVFKVDENEEEEEN